MSGPVSRPALVGALLKKELKAYSRDRIYLFLTLLVLVLVPISYHFLPDSVDETITLGVSPPIASMVRDGKDALREMGATPEQLAQLDEAGFAEGEQGLRLVEFEDDAELAKAVEGAVEVWRTGSGKTVMRDMEAGDAKPPDAERVSLDIGIAFPDGFIADVSGGRERVTVTVYSDANVPGEIRGAMRSFVREAAYQLAGRELPVGMPDEEQIVLGQDRAGDQVALRDKFRPLIIFMVLMMETFSMASLVSTEVLQRTVTAILVTPARIADFLLAKTIFGTLMSLGQGLIILLLVGGLTAGNWSLVLVVLVLAAVMFTGVALIVGAAGKDFLGQIFYAMLFVVPMIIPAFSVLFPGTAAAWVRVIPTYPVIDVLVGALNYGATWSGSWQSLAYAALWLAVLFGAGLVILRRKVESL